MVTTGSLAYGRTLHRFLLIFFGTKQSGLDRAQHAGFVQGFLRRARCYVYHTKGLTLKENFLPAPTYAHTLHSVQVAVLKLKAHRVFHSHLPMHLEETGSNAVEKLWSSTGGYGAIQSNRRDYDAAEGHRRIEDLITLKKFESEDKGINFGEEDRSTQRDLKIELHEDQSAADANPKATYSDEELIGAWKKGDEEAKAVAVTLKMKPPVAATWWDRPWEDEEEHIAQMKQADDAQPPPPQPPSEDDEDTDDEDTDDDGGGGGGGGGGVGVGGRAARELSQALVSLAARARRKKTDPLVVVPADRGGGKVYKTTLVEEYNKGLDLSLNSSRLGRIRLSSQQLASLEQLQAAQRAKAGGGGGAGAAAEEGGGGGGAGAAPSADAPAAAASAAANTASSTEVSIGSDVAFAMDEGTGSNRRIRCWIGRVVKLFKGKAPWRRPVAVDGDLPADIFAVCEWYSEVQQSSGLKF